MTKAIFLDRDGTLIYDKHYVCSKEKFELIPNVIKGLKLLQESNFLLIITTNQSGVARGYFSEKELIDFNSWCISFFKESGISISKIYYSPYLPGCKIKKYDIISNTRKPGLGMYIKAKKDFNIDFTKSFSIGDKITDCSFGYLGLGKSFLIEKNEKEETIKKVQERKYYNTFYEDCFFNAALEILKENGK